MYVYIYIYNIFIYITSLLSACTRRLLGDDAQQRVTWQSDTLWCGPSVTLCTCQSAVCVSEWDCSYGSEQGPLKGYSI